MYIHNLKCMFILVQSLPFFFVLAIFLTMENNTTYFESKNKKKINTIPANKYQPTVYIYIFFSSISLLYICIYYIVGIWYIYEILYFPEKNKSFFSYLFLQHLHFLFMNNIYFRLWPHLGSIKTFSWVLVLNKSF